MVKVLCIVQARLTSSRLPNKVLMTLGNSKKTILEHVYDRLNKSKYIDDIVFAIPNTTANDDLAKFLDKKKISYFRGDENDVLERFYQCANQYNPNIIIRATCDNPFVDWLLADKLIESIEAYDYVSSKDTPLGTGVEVFTMNALTEARTKATTEPEHEHVTPYIINKMKSTTIPYNGLTYRLTIDEERDFYVADTLYNELYKNEAIPNIVVYDYLQNHPTLANYNRDVHQKIIGE